MFGGGAMALKSRHRMRVMALQKENRGVKWGEMGGCPLPSRLEGLGERRELPSGVRGEGMARNAFWRILKVTDRSFLHLCIMML